MKTKKFVSLLLTLCMLLSVVPAMGITASAAGDAVEYLCPVYNTDGVASSGIKEWKIGSQTDFTFVTASSSAVTWGKVNTTTWYVVDGSVTISERITCAGNVNLILKDGCSFTANKGITVTDSNSLTIYGQIKNSGYLFAYSYVNSSGAGIGGLPNTDGGGITINGGHIEAYGGDNCAGIGGGGSTKGTAGAGKKIRINGGWVYAIGAYGRNNALYKAPAIGAGTTLSSSGAASEIYVASRCKLQADSSPSPKTEILDSRTDTQDISGTLNNKTLYQFVKITPKTFPIIVSDTENGTISVDAYAAAGDTVTVTATPAVGYHVAAITATDCNNNSLTVTDGTFTMPDYSDYDSAVIVSATFEENESLSYSYPDVTSGIMEWKTGSQKNYTSVTASDAYWGAADTTTWYVVDSTLTDTNRIVCQGNVNLILKDGCTLTVNGITVTGSNSLTIYGQEDGTGGLTTSAQTNAAGIGGGGSSTTGSNITINGGTINATGGQCAAGIGGGFNAMGSNITINGGTVTANGGEYASGIGGGLYSNGSNIKVNKNMLIKADGNNPPTTVIANDGSDLAGSFNGKRYVSIEPKVAHNVTVADGIENGTAAVDIAAAIEGTTITVTTTPTEGYVLDTLKYNDGTSDTTITKDGNGNYTFTMPAAAVTVTATFQKAVAKIDAVQYATVQEAINAATNGQTVTMIANSQENVTINENANITLDLGEYDLTAAKTGDTAITNNGTLSVTGSGSITGGAVGVYQNGSLTLYGEVKVTGNTQNVYLPSGKTITAGALEDGADIGVSMETAGVFTTGDASAMAEYFFSDTKNSYAVTYTSNNYLQLESFTVDANVHVSASLTLGADVTMNILLKIDDTTDYSGYELYANGKNAAAFTSELNDNGYIEATFNDFAAKDFGYNVRFVVKKGGTIVKNFTYSVAQYCNAKINNNNSSKSLKNICNSILYYNAAAQVYFKGMAASKTVCPNFANYLPAASEIKKTAVSNTTLPANSVSYGLSTKSGAEIIIDLTEGSSIVDDNESEVTISSVTIVKDNVLFVYKGDDDKYYYLPCTITESGNVIQVRATVSATRFDRAYTLYYDANGLITSSKDDTTVYWFTDEGVTDKYGNLITTKIVQISPNNYFYTVANDNGQEEALRNLCRAMYYYGQCAAAYAN